MRTKISIVIIFIFFGGIVEGQNDFLETLDFEKVIENLLPQQELELDYNDLYDRLFSIYSSPLDLNSASRTDFQSLFLLSEDQINSILEYRDKFGGFLSVYELVSIEGFDKKNVAQISPFVAVNHMDTQSLLDDLKAPEIHDLFLRFQAVAEMKKGYTKPDTLSSGKPTSRYAGGPSRIYSRYRYSKSGKYSFGFTIEKDPGERISWDPKTSRYGMDYYSFHAMIENRGVLKRAIIGDFSLDFGQGLVFGSGLSLGKGAEPITTIRRTNFGVRPYRSVFESRDFRGIALSTSFSFFEVNAFISHVRRDAVIRMDSLNIEEQYFTAIQTIGLHRTPSEIAAKSNIVDQSIGGNVNCKLLQEKLEIGLNAVSTSYSAQQMPTRKKYNHFDFTGLNNAVGSIYFNYYLRKAHLFSEIAISKSGGKALSAGVIASLSAQVQASFHYRNHQQRFHSFYGASFGENSKIANEEGFYWGLKIFPVRKMMLTSYIDLFKFPWLKYRVDKPSYGRDFMVSAHYDINSNLHVRAMFRSKMKEENMKIADSPEIRIIPKTTNRIVFNMNYKINEFYSIQSRIQKSNVTFDHQNKQGFLIAQDVNYKRARFSASARFALFDTEDYDNRQFIYERDLLYLYSIPAFYNRGIRYYFLAKLQISRSVETWLKISQTKYVDQGTIGTGLEEINGNTRTSINAQIRIKM